MKKLISFWPAFAGALLLTMCFTFTACGSDDSSDDPNDPTASVPDPEGTIEMKVRNGNNGKTVIEDFVFINDANNFIGNNTSTATKIVSLGAMKGLGNVTRIPGTGWAKEVGVKKGYGYVAYDGAKSHQFYRIYVTKSTTNVSNEIIGWEVKYQKGFKGNDVTLKPDLTSVKATKYPSSYLRNMGSYTQWRDCYNQEIQFQNSELCAYTVEVEDFKEWCTIPSEMQGPDGFVIRIEKPEMQESEKSCKVTVTTAYGKKTVIDVNRVYPN